MKTLGICFEGQAITINNLSTTSDRKWVSAFIFME